MCRPFVQMSKGIVKVRSGDCRCAARYGFVSGVGAVTGSWVLHKRPNTVLWLLRPCICEVHRPMLNPKTGHDRLDGKLTSYARLHTSSINIDHTLNCSMGSRLFVTVLLCADLPDDPLLPELALLIGNHDAIVS